MDTTDRDSEGSPVAPPERIEVRRNDDGTIDEVLLYSGERCVFHLEQLDTGSWYFGLYPDPSGEPDAEQFYIWSKRRVHVRRGSDRA